MITQTQIKTLKGNCPECNHDRTGFFNEWDRVIKKTSFPELCICKGTGQATIEIEKEWVECDAVDADKIKQNYHTTIRDKHWKHCKCNGKGKISKYKVGEEIEEFVCHHLIPEDAGLEYQHYCEDKIKLEIITETEDKQRLIMVR